MSFHTHVAEKNWSTKQRRNHTVFKNTEQFLEVVGNASVGKAFIGKAKEARAIAQNKRDGGRKKADEEEETISVEEILKPQESSIGNVSESKRKAVFSYAVRCLNCPINYDPKMLLAYSEDNYASLARLLNLQGVDLRSEIRTARRCGKLILTELEQRLSSLNNHYFYNSKNFQERSHFELWKETEEDRIKKLIQKMRGVPRFSGTLSVTVVDAKDLQLKDDEPQPTNPYCFLVFNKVEQRTAVINKTIDPEWNEEFTFNIAAEDEVLNVQIWNKILVGSTFLGGIEIPISEIQELQKPTQWFQLTGQGKAKNVTGSVRLSFKLVCREGPALDEKAASRDSEYSSFGYEQSTDHNDYYAILLYHLYASDLSAKEQKTNRKRNQRKKGDDDEIIVEKWGDAWKEVGTDGKEVAKQESLDTRNRREEMKQGRISASTKWLLNEYAERYGIGIFYIHLAQAEMLVDPFVFSTDRMDFIYEVLIEFKIMESSEPLQLTIAERKMHENMKASLAEKLIILLKNFPTAFDPEVISKGGVQTAIVLLSHLQDIDASQLPELLASYVKCAVTKSYKSFKETAKDESVERQLCVACGFIPAAIGKDVAVFAEEFPKDLNFAQLLGEQYYSELSKDVKTYYSQEVPLTASTFDVYFRLNDLHDVIRKDIAKKDMLDLAAIFQKYIDPWVQNFVEKFCTWNKESIEQDDWTPIRPDEDDEHETVVLHSSSAADLFTAFYEFLKFFQKLKGLRTPQHTKSFAFAISTVVKDYVVRVQSLCFEEMNEQVDDASKDFSAYLELSKEMRKRLDKGDKSVLTIKQELCVRINNIDSIFDQLETFCEKFDDDDDSDERSRKEPSFGELVEETSGWLRSMRKEVVDAVVTKMNAFIQFALELAAQPTNEKKKRSKKKLSDSEESEDDDDLDRRLEPLIAYLRTQLIVLSDNLYYPVFLTLLNGIWEVILKDIELVILPSPDQLLDKSYPFDEDFIDLVPGCVSTLSRFLYAEGRGLPKEDLVKASGNLKKILQLFEEPTATLTKLYERLLDSQENYKKSKGELGESDQTYTAFLQLEESVLSILARRKNDKEAIKFVKAHKSNAQNMHLTKHFGLPRSETLVDKFKCCNQKVSGGWIYVTTSYVCFDTLLFGGQKIVLKIEDIRELKKKKFAGVLDNSLKIEMKTGKSYLFTGFVLGYRNTCYTLILKQAEKLDCLLGQAFRNGQLQDDDSDDDMKPRGSGIFGKKKAHSRSVSVNADNLGASSPGQRKSANLEFEFKEDPRKKAPSTETSRTKLSAESVSSPGKGHKRGPSFSATPPSISPNMAKRSSLQVSNRDSSGSTETESDLGSEMSETETEPDTDDEDGGAKSSEKKAKKEQKKKERQEKREARKKKREERKAKKAPKKEGSSEDSSTKKSKEPKDKDLEKQADRTEKLRKRFNLGENSRFIEKFSCHYDSHGGFFYVANTHICFLSKGMLSSTKLAIPFSLVTNVSIKKEKRSMLEIGTKDKSFLFSKFDDLEAVFQLVSKGWKKRTNRQ